MKKAFYLNAENGAIVAVSDIIQKTCGLVAIGEVQTGNISAGDVVNIPSDKKEPLSDEIRRIELSHEKIETAAQGQKVGILLKATSKEELLQFLETN